MNAMRCPDCRPLSWTHPLVDVSALDVPQFEQDAYQLEVDCV
jgi:hypothetical protein